ncbi:MAG: hypothetical protein ACTSSG_05195 [Candidatus Heimdallarchaeaceae archaeon]
MDINLSKLGYDFLSKPLVIGGRAMEYYNLRLSGKDVDLIITNEDYEQLVKKYPDSKKEVWGDYGITLDNFEIWKSIFLYDYDFYSKGAIEEDSYFVISLEKLLFIKALVAKEKKQYEDLLLVAEEIIKRKYRDKLTTLSKESAYYKQIEDWLNKSLKKK